MRSDHPLCDLPNLVPGDHLCALYRTEEERRSVLVSFVRQGIELGEKVLYLKDGPADEQLLADLDSYGIPFETYLQNGQLCLLPLEETHLLDDLFDPDRMVGMLQDETERALAEGFTALRVTGGTDWVLQRPQDVEQLIEYEYKANAFIVENKCLVLCHYDLSAHDQRVILAIMAAHPDLIVGTEKLENIHFDLVENPVTFDMPQLILQHQIEVLLEHKQAEQRLRESELAYRTLAENLPGIVYRVFLQEGKSMQFFNKAAQDVTGYAIDELAPGRVCAIDPLILPDERDGIIAEVQNAIGERRPFSVSYRLRHKDGSMRYVLEQGTPVYSQDGTPHFIDGVIFDITEQKWAEEALRLQAQIIDQIHDAVVSTDLDGYVTTWNKGAERLFGHRAEEALGKHISFLYRENQYDFLEKQVIAPVMQKGVHEVELEMLNSAGEKFFAHLSLSILRDQSGAVTGMIGYSKDITAQVRAQDQLKARAEQQTVVVELGQRALAGVELSELMDEAVARIASTLGVEFCKILELSEDGGSLLLRAGVGWRDGVVGHTLVDAGENSQAGYTLLSNEPVVVENLLEEKRFSGPNLLLGHGVIAGISTPIKGLTRPFGVLGAHTVIKRIFSRDDVNFIQAVANVLASAINRKHSEEALGESETRFRTQYKALPVPTYTWQFSGDGFKLIDYNDAAEDVTKGHIFEFLGCNTTELYANRADILDDFEVCFNKKRTIKREMDYRSFITGNVGRFSVSYVHIPPDLVMVHMEDITERKRAEEERSHLLAVERRARHAADAMREATAALSVTLDMPQLLDEILLNLKQVIQYDHACLVLEEDSILRVMACKGFPDPSVIVNREYPLDDEEFFGEILRLGGPLIISDAQKISQRKCCRGDGGIRSWMGVPFVFTGKIIGFLSVDSHLPACYDHTEATLAQTFANQAAVVIENTRLFDEVNAARERLRLLTKKVVAVQEQERQRVSRELHDEIGQTLTAVKLSIQALQHRESSNSLSPRLDDTIKIVEQALQQVRNLSLDLRPTLLDDLGLVSTLRWYVDRQAKWGGFDAKFTAKPVEMRLPWELETTCFRIVQEALTNVMRHAKPQNVCIELLLDDEVLKLTIKDDGVGFDVSSAIERAAQGNSMGLLGMQERVALIGGKLAIKSLQGKGTTIQALFPVYWLQRLNQQIAK